VSKLLKSTFIVSFGTLVSRVFGYVRDLAIAAKLGTGMLNDAFIAAFKLANMFRNIFAEGAMHVVFVPEFSQVLQEKGEKEALLFAAKVQSLLLVTLSVICAVAIIAMPQIMWYIAPGFRHNEYMYSLAVLFGRITFPYFLCISLASFYGGILNSFNKFFIFSIAPVILNITIIIALLFFDDLRTSAHTLSVATLIGGILELVWMACFLLKNGYILRFVKLEFDHKIKRTFKNMVPIIIASGVTHINAWISMIVLSFFPGGLSYMYYADRIVQLPLALLGTAIGTVLLPMLAKSFKKDKKEDILEIQNYAITLVMFLTIPATFGMLFLSKDIICVLFERGEFLPISTIKTREVLLLLSVGLPAFILTKLFQTSFYAKLNTKTPVVIAVICILTNLAISISLMHSMQYLGVAIANVVSGWVNFILLLIFAVIMLNFRFRRSVILETAKFLLASAFMLVGLWLFKQHVGFANKYIALLSDILMAVVIYLVCSYFLKSKIYYIKRSKRATEVTHNESDQH
jgi:putative peptidoglycan lipid II flippase